MKKKFVKAIFRGADGSLGYEKNKEYSLAVSQKIGENIKIKRTDGTGKCEYANIQFFLDNWDNIRVM